MKKLLSVLAVAAIVTGAFAFTKKNTQFCVKSGSACAIISEKLIDNDHGTEFFQYPRGVNQWDGTETGCTSASPLTNCVVSVKLSGN